MISIERAEIGMHVLTKNDGTGVIVGFEMASVPSVHAVVKLDETGEEKSLPLFWLSSLATA